MKNQHQISTTEYAYLTSLY